MGNGIIKFYREKVKTSWKIAFISTMIIGFLTHTYKFTNQLLSHDSIYNYYSSQNMIQSGRWFLSIACGFSSYFDLHWLIGIFSVILISLTAVVIVDLFKMENPVLIILTCGLFITFPAITDTFYFSFTADGYMLSMLLAALAVRLSVIGEKRIWRLILSSVFICLSCAIYQAYVSFALVLALIYFMFELLSDEHSVKDHFIWIRNQIFIYITSMSAYLIIWKVCLYVQNVSPSHYAGIDNVTNVGSIDFLSAAINCVKNFVFFFIRYNFFELGITPWIFFSIALLISTAIIVIISIFKSELFKSKPKFILFLAAALLIPFVSFIWLFVSKQLLYDARLCQCLVLVFIFSATLCDKYIKCKINSIFCFVFVIFILNNIVSANIVYRYIERSNRHTYANAIEISSQIHSFDSGNEKYIFISGTLNTWEDDHDEYVRFTHITPISVMSNNLLHDHYIYSYLKNEIDFTLSYYKMNPDADMPSFFDAVDIDCRRYMPVPTSYTFDFPVCDLERQREIVETQEYKQMPCWPAADSVRVFGDTIVVKLSP